MGGTRAKWRKSGGAYWKTRGRQHVAGRETVSEGQEARQRAACPGGRVSERKLGREAGNLDWAAGWPACAMADSNITGEWG